MDRRLGARIREAREAVGMTRAALAGLLAIDVSVLGKIERGMVSVSAWRLAQIASHLRKPVSWFYRGLLTGKAA